MEEKLKEVLYGDYCRNCKYEEAPESDDPCDECLENPGREFSHKPLKFESK